MQILSLDGEEPLEKEMETHFSILAWRIPRREEPGRLPSTGLQRVRHDWSNVVELVWNARKQRGTKEPLDESERREWKSWLKTQHSKNQDRGIWFHQFSSVTQSCLTLCDPMNHNTSGLPVHHYLREFTQTHVHWVGDAIQPSHLLLSLRGGDESSRPSIFPSIRVFSNESALCIRWPKYWSFSFNISPPVSSLLGK